MSTRVLVFATAALLFCSGLVLADPNAYTGVVSIDTVTARPGDHISVPVRLTNNNAPIAAMFIPLRLGSPNLLLESISFEDVMLPENYGGSYGYDTAAGTIRIGCFGAMSSPIPTVTDPNGVICYLNFKVSASAAPSTIKIDTMFTDSVILGDIHQETRITFADNTGLGSGQYYPGFVPGAVIVTSPTDVNDNDHALPVTFSLDQNYPNPFNPTTKISYSLPKASHVKLEVFNVLGQQVRVLENTNKGAGSHTVDFDASKCPSGIYFYRLTTDQNVATRKMVLLK